LFTSVMADFLSFIRNEGRIGGTIGVCAAAVTRAPNEGDTQARARDL